MVRKHKPLFFILFIIFVKSVIWALVIPPLQTPDESVHFEYVQYIGEENKVPIMRETGQYSTEMLLFYQAVGLNSIAYSPENKYKIDMDKYNQLSNGVSKKERTSNGSSVAAGYPPGYYFFASLFYKFFYFSSIFVKYYAVKLFSIILGLIAVALVYLIGRKLAPKSNSLAIALSLIIGFHPMFSMVSIAVNNDILMNTMSIAIMLSVIYIIENPSFKRLLITGTLIGFGLIIKPTMVFVCGLALLVILIFFIKQKYQIAFTLKSVMLVVVPILILYLPWAIFSLNHYNTLTGGIGMQPPGDPNVDLKWYFNNAFLTEAAIKRSFDLWIVSFWANFGWLDTRFATNTIYFVLALLCSLGAIGALYGILMKKENYKVVSICLSIVVLNVLFLYAVEIQYFLKFHNFMLQGRYLFTSIVPISVILIYGIKYLVHSSYEKYSFYTMCLLMIIFNIFSVDLIFNRYY